MSTENPTVEDLRTVAHNLQAEEQNSRAEVIYSAATKLERMEARLQRIEEVAQKIVVEEDWFHGIQDDIRELETALEGKQ